MQKASDPEQVPRGTVAHLLTGLLLGLIAGSGLLLLMDRADDRINSSTEVTDIFTEPILGQIPNVAVARVGSRLPLLTAEDERYSFAESFRSLRSSLIFMPNQPELRSRYRDERDPR